MTVPIQIPWDLYQGKAAVWCECVNAGVRRAVLLPRLDPIFAPVEEDPARELHYAQLDWRLVSPTESDWTRYLDMVAKMAKRARLEQRVQRVESVARWVGGRQVAVPQYHIWLYRDEAVSATIDRLYEELDSQERRNLWRWLLAWTAPAQARNPSG
ncbi:MAG TPA: hypothetical protein VK864_12630 [Longimicrobiales bacterium]|nr:hypothetical protein [Longimicrobiales bacterium]